MNLVEEVHYEVAALIGKILTQCLSRKAYLVGMMMCSLHRLSIVFDLCSVLISKYSL